METHSNSWPPERGAEPLIGCECSVCFGPCRWRGRRFRWSCLLLAVCPSSRRKNTCKSRRKGWSCCPDCRLSLQLDACKLATGKLVFPRSSPPTSWTQIERAHRANKEPEGGRELACTLNSSSCWMLLDGRMALEVGGSIPGSSFKQT